MKILHATILVAMLPTTGTATTITFEEIPDETTFPISVGSPASFETQGYTVTALTEDQRGGAALVFDALPRSVCDPDCPINGTNYLFNLSFTSTSIVESSGLPFTLTSFDAAEGHYGQDGVWARQIDVVGQLFGGGVVTTSFFLDFVNGSRVVDFESFALPAEFANLKSVQFDGVGGANEIFSLDNIELTASSLPIPEPSTIFLLGTGLAGFVGCTRARNK